MNKRELQLLDRVQLCLLTEQKSRYDDGRMLEPSQLPDDGVRRVLVGEVFTGSYSNDRVPQQTLRPLLQICVQAMQRLSSPSDVLWCFGEERLDRILLMKAWLGDTIHYKAGSSREHIFLFPLDSSVKAKIGPWPILSNERSLHIFATDSRQSKMHLMLKAFYEGLEEGSTQSVEPIYELMKRCLSRSEVKAMLGDMPMVLLPDGSHFWFPSIQTTSIEISTIVQVFADLAHQYEWKFSCEENVADRYLDFFQYADFIIIED